MLKGSVVNVAENDEDSPVLTCSHQLTLHQSPSSATHPPFPSSTTTTAKSLSLQKEEESNRSNSPIEEDECIDPKHLPNTVRDAFFVLLARKDLPFHVAEYNVLQESITSKLKHVTIYIIGLLSLSLSRTPHPPLFS